MNSTGYSLSTSACSTYTHICFCPVVFLVIEQVKGSIITETWRDIEWSTPGSLRCAFQTAAIDCLCLSTVHCSKNTAVLICSDTVLRAVIITSLPSGRQKEAKLSWLFFSLLMLELGFWAWLLNIPRSICLWMRQHMKWDAYFCIEGAFVHQQGSDYFFLLLF